MDIIQRRDDHFSVQVRPEGISRRLWVTGYSAVSPGALQGYLLDLARRLDMGKIIFPVRSSDAPAFAGHGFIEEGRIPGYFNGEDAHFLAAFPAPERSVSPTLAAEKRMLREIRKRPGHWNYQTSSTIKIRRAVKDDAVPLAGLFRKAFDSYPTPVFDPQYLSKSMDGGHLFMVACRSGKIVAAAAAEIDYGRQRSEMSDCATSPEYRGLGLNSALLRQIARECASLDIRCMFSLARASSYGMNLVLHRLGYIYGGTLVNNCHIGGRLENMHIWTLPAAAQENAM
jgi:putative beta-lysine N-acetyltransferase